MVQIIWNQQSINDLNNISAYIAKDSPKYADSTVDRIFERTEVLKSHPNTGRIVPEINRKEIRELIEGNYRIMYKVIDKNIVEILTVHHSSKLLR